jgi:uncharacterized damage-inducible protein DinB
VRAVDAWSRPARSKREHDAANANAIGASEAVGRERWFDRTFPEVLPAARFPAILERLRGTPARLEEAVRGATREALTLRLAGKWTAQEHVGHLGDLEPLWFARLDDLEGRNERLRPADLENSETNGARHDERDLGELLHRFRAARSRLVARLESWENEKLAIRALHPRTQQLMSGVEHAYFVAEHDDHHLASIRALLARSR